MSQVDWDDFSNRICVLTTRTRNTEPIENVQCRSICTQQYILLGTTTSYPATLVAGHGDVVPSNSNAAARAAVCGGTTDDDDDDDDLLIPIISNQKDDEQATTPV